MLSRTGTPLQRRYSWKDHLLKWLYRIAILVAFSMRGFAQPLPLTGSPDPSQYAFVSLETGWGNVFKPADYFSGVFEFSVGIPLKMWLFYPVTGGYVTTRSATYLYGGVMLPVKLSRLISLQGTCGAGYYQPGDDMNLFLSLEFNLMAEISFSLKNGYRLAVKWAHLSNGGIGYRNPGTERITVGLKIPYL